MPDKGRADVLDVNVGFPGVDGKKLLAEAVIAIQSILIFSLS
jgi:hypothetical protein